MTFPVVVSCSVFNIISFNSTLALVSTSFTACPVFLYVLSQSSKRHENEIQSQVAFTFLTYLEYDHFPGVYEHI